MTSTTSYSPTSSSTVSSPSNPANAVSLLDVNRGNKPLQAEIMAAIQQVVESGRFLHGPEVGELECKVAGVCKTDHAIGCASGSDALLLALLALGVGPGDEVIVPSFTFFATASCVTRVGAKIVFADINPDTFNIDPQDVAEKITARTKAIIPVHLFGLCAEMETLASLSQARGIHLIEDAAQSIGAARFGRPAGSWGDVGCLSFYPTKNLGGMGDGGMIVCQDPELASRIRLFAAHGMQPRYHHQVVGINSRLDTIQAAILNVKIDHLQEYSQARRDNAARYGLLLGESDLGEFIQLPQSSPESFHVWNQYGIRVPKGRRDELRQALQGEGIGSEIYYPIPLHLQPCFSELGYFAGSLPETERAAHEILNLPIYPELSLDEQLRVVESIGRFFKKKSARHAA